MPGRLNRETVLAEALAVVDGRGAEALSMRALAERLGVTPMAIYNHVAGKRDLLDGVAELVAREMRPPDPGGPWRERLAECLRRVRRALLAHPNAILLVQNARSPQAALLAPTEAALDALAAGGLDPHRALQAWSALSALTLGHVRYELAGHMREGDRPLPAGEFPRIAASLATAPFDWDETFEVALRALIDGLSAGRRPRPTRARARAR